MPPKDAIKPLPFFHLQTKAKNLMTKDDLSAQELGLEAAKICKDFLTEDASFNLTNIFSRLKLWYALFEVGNLLELIYSL